MILDWCRLMNFSLHAKQSWDDKSLRFQSGAFVLLITWKQVISSCKVYSILTMLTLAWENLEFGNFILITTIHFWNQSVENSMLSSPLGCDFVTSPTCGGQLLAFGIWGKLHTGIYRSNKGSQQNKNKSHHNKNYRSCVELFLVWKFSNPKSIISKIGLRPRASITSPSLCL